MSDRDEIDPCDHHSRLGNLAERVKAIEDYLGIRAQKPPVPDPAPAPEPRAPARKRTPKR